MHTEEDIPQNAWFILALQNKPLRRGSRMREDGLLDRKYSHGISYYLKISSQGESTNSPKNAIRDSRRP